MYFDEVQIFMNTVHALSAGPSKTFHDLEVHNPEHARPTFHRFMHGSPFCSPRLAKGSPTVAKSRTLYLKSHLKSLKSLKFQNLKSRKVETVISKFLYIFASNHVKIGRTISNKLSVKITNHGT